MSTPYVSKLRLTGHRVHDWTIKDGQQLASVLPPEMWAHILLYVHDERDALALGCTCSRLRDIVAADSTWRPLMTSTYGREITALVEDGGLRHAWYNWGRKLELPPELARLVYGPHPGSHPHIWSYSDVLQTALNAFYVLTSGMPYPHADVDSVDVTARWRDARTPMLSESDLRARALNPPVLRWIIEFVVSDDPLVLRHMTAHVELSVCVGAGFSLLRTLDLTRLAICGGFSYTSEPANYEELYRVLHTADVLLDAHPDSELCVSSTRSSALVRVMIDVVRRTQPTTNTLAIQLLFGIAGRRMYRSLAAVLHTVMVLHRPRPPAAVIYAQLCAQLPEHTKLTLTNQLFARAHPSSWFVTRAVYELKLHVAPPGGAHWLRCCLVASGPDITDWPHLFDYDTWREALDEHTATAAVATPRVWWVLVRMFEATATRGALCARTARAAATRLAQFVGSRAGRCVIRNDGRWYQAARMLASLKTSADMSELALAQLLRKHVSAITLASRLTLAVLHVEACVHPQPKPRVVRITV